MEKKLEMTQALLKLVREQKEKQKVIDVVALAEIIRKIEEEQGVAA